MFAAEVRAAIDPARIERHGLRADLAGPREGFRITLDAAEVRSRAMGRALKQVEALPAERSAALLPLPDGDE